MKMTRERDVAIDFENGLFLFLIVIGHFWNYPDEIRFLIAPTDLIYVPVFFFLSGYLARKVKTLLLPYLSFFIPSSIGSCILVTVVVKKYISKLSLFERPLIWIAQNGIVILSCHFYIVCCVSWILKHFKMESMISFVAQLISVFLGVYLIIPILKKCKPALWGI